METLTDAPEAPDDDLPEPEDDPVPEPGSVPLTDPGAETPAGNPAPDAVTEP